GSHDRHPLRAPGTPLPVDGFDGRGPDRARRPGAVPAEGLDDAVSPRHLARAPHLPRAQTRMRRVPDQRAVPVIRRGRAGSGARPGPAALRAGRGRWRCGIRQPSVGCRAGGRNQQEGAGMTSTDAGRPGGLDDDAVRESLAGLLNAPAPGEWLRRADAPAGMNVRDAAVLMLFGRGQEPRTSAGKAEVDRLAQLGIADVDLVLLQRAATLRHHAGQPAFPGGARDETDTSSAFTALRE